ncbi:Hypothetical protein CINCED_3A015272 [Cinara cedri]|uniref:Uncharacterized protein n=1 Tax=Cinara cedri TaxID=506608 RepID=A0A5E4N1U4_9HEMI|nr:Hypothetical protein CINCED_3A015272 [Cinara cedri]
MKTAHKLLEISAPATDDEICMAAMDDYENKDLMDTTSNSYKSTTYGKRVSSANTMSAVRAKKLSPIKFNLKLEATYFQPLIENSSENRAFKTSAIEIFKESDFAEIIETSYMKLVSEEETYKSRGSGFTLESIDGLLLAVYRYTPLSVSSYIQLPSYLENKRATINPQNTDQQCFKWAILAKHVMGHSVHRLGENYFKHEDKYNFEDISFLTPLADISKFEKNNPYVSVNVYGLEKKFHPPRKYLSYEVFPLRVSVSEKVNHFDLWS